MDKKEMLGLYEKLYFHEIDARERLNSRLQTPLTLIISFIGVFAFMLQNFEYQGCSWPTVFFLFILACGAFFLVAATFFFIKSWHGNEYEFLPAAEKTEDYHSALVDLYTPYDDGEKITAQHFDNYIREYYIKCSSANTKCNDLRSICVHKTNTALIATAVLVFSAFLVFYFGKLDKANLKKPTEVIVVAPIKITGEKND